MAESTLQLTTTQLRKEVALHMGYRTEYGGLLQHQQDEVDWIINEGLRRFYSPPVLPGESRPHQWSFLTPRTTLALVAGTTTYTLPDNFGGIVDPFTYASGTSRAPIGVVTDEELRRRATISSSSGNPTCVAIVAKVSSDDSPNATPDIPTRWQAVFWPTPSEALTLTYRYYVIQDAPTTTLNPPGGSLFGHVIRASCLAVLEDRLNHNRPNSSTVHATRFREILASAVGMDRRMNNPRILGVMTDTSDGAGLYEPTVSVLYNGVQY